jgi:hypothetical protein
MSGYLLDTNVISEVLRPLPNIRVIDWCREVTKEVVYLSVVSLGAIRKGLTMMPGGLRRSQLFRSGCYLCRVQSAGGGEWEKARFVRPAPGRDSVAFGGVLS